MVRGAYLRLNADDRSYLAILKKEVHKMAETAGFSGVRLAELDIIAAELSTNLIKHADKGEVLAGIIDTAHGPAIDLVAIDHGPGIADVSRIMSDGFSTTNTLGHGLGSLKRLSDDFQLYSQPKWGTIAIARKYKDEVTRPSKRRMSINALIVPKPGETLSGDAACCIETKTQLRLLVADGLGHGPEANHAVSEAIRLFKLEVSQDPCEILRNLHLGIRKTRGAVINIFLYTFATNEWKVCGIGNITTKFMGSFSHKNYIAYNGIVGHNIPGTMKEHIFNSKEFPTVIVTSDGLKSRWESAKYPNMQKYDGRVLAAALYRDFTRGNDDTSILICRI